MRAFPNARMREVIEETKRDQQADCVPQKGDCMLDTCPGCANAVRPEDKFCSNCARPLSPSSQQNITSHIGEHNIGSFIGSTLQNTNINFHEPPRGDPIAEIGRTQLKPLKLFGHPLKVGWLIFTGVMCFIAQLASISSGFFSGKLLSYTPFWFWAGLGVLFIGALCFGGGIQLYRFRFSALIGPYGLQAGADNSVHLIKISGICPICSGELTLQSIGPKKLF
jgi:hypothetical protein